MKGNRLAERNAAAWAYREDRAKLEALRERPRVRKLRYIFGTDGALEDLRSAFEALGRSAARACRTDGALEDLRSAFEALGRSAARACRAFSDAVLRELLLCPRCNGRGRRWFAHRCRLCNGSGWLHRKGPA